jgi:plastocyanin
MRAALVAAACGALIGIPALARAQAPATDYFTAQDVAPMSGRWDANGDASTSSLTIVSGGTVTFSYQTGASEHGLAFTGAAKPSCTGVPELPPSPAGWGPGWTATCHFSDPGRYPFVCPLHPAMTGTVTVNAAPTPTPTPGASPTPTPTPVYGATPTPTPTPTPQRTLKLALASRQQGTHVRGSVQVQSAHTRLEVTVSAKLTGRRAVRVGHWLKRSAPAGRVAFSVPLIARARHTLARRHELAVTVRVGLTPLGGRMLNRAAKATVRPG